MSELLYHLQLHRSNPFKSATVWVRCAAQQTPAIWVRIFKLSQWPLSWAIERRLALFLQAFGVDADWVRSAKCIHSRTPVRKRRLFFAFHELARWAPDPKVLTCYCGNLARSIRLARLRRVFTAERLKSRECAVSFSLSSSRSRRINTFR